MTTPVDFYTAVAVATTVIAVATTTASPTVFGAEAVLAGWHLALTATCLLRMLAGYSLHRNNNTDDRLDMLVLVVQVLNAVSLVVHGSGAGRGADSLVVSEHTSTSSQSVSLVLIWGAVAATTVIATADKINALTTRCVKMLLCALDY
jgi:hypothetical protein